VPTTEETFGAFARLFPEGDLVEALGDEERVAAFRGALAAIAAPDVEVAMVGPGGFSNTFWGVEGFVRGWRDWLEPFETYRMELEPEIHRGPETAVFFARQVATPRGSANPVTSDAAAVGFFRAGKVHRLEFHLDRAAALRSAGLQ
jgi:ketosteroid isomerase-like protein